MKLETETASTWDSYYPSLTKVLEAFNPERCFEWGIGKSTKVIGGFPSVKVLDSVEHSPDWVDRVRPLPTSALVIFEDDKDLYPFVSGRIDGYDLIFVDGLIRYRCLEEARNKLVSGGIVVLHDAEREEYQSSIKLYKHNIFVDDGHTAYLTDDDVVADKLREVLCGL